jgi:iron complex outermembrane receptor protein
MRTNPRPIAQVVISRRLGAALLCWGATLAAAQAPLPDAAPAQARDDTPFDEIVVTAQRREQKLQDVGISVTPISADTLQNLNINTATDIVRAVPSLKMNAYSSSQVVFNIRGVSQNDYGDQQEPPVAVYQDDSYSSSINLASFPVFDLARVETLRGPQGTLFGRNATGGAIQFISRKPTREFEGYATATYGRFNQAIVEGAVSGPLRDNLQGRIAVIRNKDDGYMKSVVAGIPDRGGNDHYALRAALAWQPGEGTDVGLTVRYMRADKETQAGLYSQEPACPNARFQGEFTPPTLACAYWGSPAGATGSGYRNDAITPSRGGDPWSTAETQQSYVDRKIFGTTLRVDATIGELGLVSISDYQHGDKFYIEGGDASPDEGVFFYQGSKLDQASQEFRLSATAGAHSLVGGLFGMYVDGKYTGKFADPFYGYDPDVSFSQRTTSWALFLQDEWQLDARWKLIGGLRYWHDSRQGTYLGTETSLTGVTIIFNQNQVFPVFAGSPVTPATAKRNFSDVTARLELDYKPGENALWYVSFNRGSKSGGYTFSTGTPFAGFEQAFLEGIPFKPEVLDAFEAGIKATVGRATTLNVSGFYYRYNDYQAFAQFGPVQTVINLNATVRGLEAELNARPIHGLTLQLGTSLLDTNVENVPLPDGVTIEDHDLPQAPRFSGNALARYEFPLGRGMGSVQADAQYSASFCFTVLCAPVEQEKAYTIANARVGYASADGRWNVAAFVDNLGNAKYRVYAFDSSLFAGVVAGVYARPRTYGVTATYRFGGARD